MKLLQRFTVLIILALLVAACAPLSSGGTGQPGTGSTPGATADTSPLTCPLDIQIAVQGDSDCQTPRSLRTAYGVESLVQRGYAG